MEKLKNVDPDFYTFLKEQDANLLNFQNQISSDTENEDMDINKIDFNSDSSDSNEDEYSNQSENDDLDVIIG